jgi:5-methyltetrahydrofolate--homocysteine methyltransferase
VSSALRTRLVQRDILISDGALGTMLQQHGIEPGQCPESWCISHPEIVKGIATAYADSGSDIVSTNSFGANALNLKPYGLADKVLEFNRAAAMLVKGAVGSRAYVAGSVGPTGQILKEEGGEMSASEVYEAYKEQVLALVEGGVDTIWLETFSSLPEAIQGLRAAKDNANLPVACTFTFQAGPKGFHTMMGVKPDRAAREAAAAGADIVGANCSNGIAEMIDIARQMHAACPNLPLLIQPNAGKPTLENGRAVFKETPESMCSRVPELLQAGASIIGGCCGTTPAHIAAVAKALAHLRSRL